MLFMFYTRTARNSPFYMGKIGCFYTRHIFTGTGTIGGLEKKHTVKTSRCGMLQVGVPLNVKDAGRSGDKTSPSFAGAGGSRTGCMGEWD